MPKTIDIKSLVRAADPQYDRQEEPGYEFTGRTFKGKKRPFYTEVESGN